MNETQEAQEAQAKQIQEEFDKLLEEYLKSSHRRKIEIITKAFNLANEAHAGAKRKGGDPYIMHPLAVARIVCSEMGLGSTSICAALLHDVVEDTNYEEEDIRNMFGDKIAQIVSGLTKIIPGEVTLGANDSLQVENFRKLFLTSSEDIRVVLIKIADRLHNMRTLGPMRRDKQLRNTGETLAVFAPLAYRLGLNKIKTELEDLCLEYEYPDDYSNIKAQLKETEEERNNRFETFKQPIKELLDGMTGIKKDYRFDARVKSVYSIWNKMQAKSIPFKEVYDLYAARIVFEPLSEADETLSCLQIYNTVAKLYTPKPNRMRDFINHPKPNHYQALHLTVMGPDGNWIEVQIRSKRMDEIAEKGVAAHWKYKGISIDEDSELEKWMPTIAEILQNPNPDTIARFDEIKLNLSLSDISVFTPKGDMKTLPQGATVLDFAYLLHSDIGNKCIGAKVNHKLVPLSYQLASADQVEILTSRSQEPQLEWLKYVATSKARRAINKIFEPIRKEEAKRGEEKVLSAFQKAGLDYDSFNIDKLALFFGFDKREDFFCSVEKGETTLPVNIKKIVKNKSGWFTSTMQAFGMGSKNKSKDTTKEGPTNNLKEIDKSQPYLLKENSGYVIAKCCKPIPGDDALGFIQDNAVIVHKQSCKIAIGLKSSYANRIVATKWDTHTKASFEATIVVTGIDSLGVLREITQVISDEFNVNILHLVVDAKDGVFNGKIKMQVHNLGDIQKLCVRLSKIRNLKSVSRVAD
ncbi:MAG: RelA/SpoT family protein [Tannerellaceae bacterium]|jgi:GTP pyrophosphokinase|nr:RelA/SpoT family protein [Tannerellaceae bacterium]